MKHSHPNRIGVVGSGLAGLAAACTLAARGHSVVLFEKSSWLGGKAAELREGGFRFDMGPTILTIPNVLRRVFTEAGRKLEDYLELVKLDPQWRCLFTDGSVLDLVSDLETMADSLDQFSPGSGSAAGYRQFLELSDRLHRISNQHFFWKSIGGIGDMIDFKAGFSAKILGDVISMRMGRSVAGTVRKFVPDSRVAQMLDHFTQYVGSSPESSPAVLCGIAHMQTNDGVWYPMGGTRAVPEALTKLATELGVELRPNTGIRRVILNETQDTVVGVETESGERIELDAVVSNADSVRTHRELLNGSAPRVVTKFENRREYEPACSGVVLYLGLNRAYDHLLHHDFVFSRDPHEEFDFIYHKGEPAPDPTCYLCAPAHQLLHYSQPFPFPPHGVAIMFTRRQFLGTSTAAVLAGPLAAIEPIKRPGSKPDMKLSLAAYSFRQSLDLKKPTMTMFDFIDLAATLPLDAVELTSYYFAETTDAYFDKLKAHCAAKKLAISGVPVGNNFCYRDETKRRAEIDKTKAWIERAGKLGAKTVRIFAGNLEKGDTLEEAQKRVVAAINECCEVAVKAGVLLALENHGGITSTPEQLLALVKPVTSPALGVNIDTGNFRTPDPYADVATITPYGVNVQVKTELFPAGKPKEEADLKRFVKILADANYHGYVALEYEAAEDAKVAVPKYVKELRGLIGG